MSSDLQELRDAPEVDTSSAADPRPASSAERRQAALEVFFIFVVFFVHAGWPAPDVNESHYLCKAKQFWDPQWLPGDFFLNSADAHWTFYWTFGWLTRLMPLAAFAWCGRVITWLGLAWAFRRLSWSLSARPWCAVLGAALFVAFDQYGDLAGEWAVGGLEAKGPAFVLVLLGLERLVKNRWNAALLLCGGSAAFHVLVGGWTLAALGFAWLVMGQNRPRLMAVLPGLAGGLVLSLPGLVPALLLSWQASDAEFHLANQVYVFQRLRHHLMPDALDGQAIVLHGLLLLGWLTLYLRWRTLREQRALAGVVLGGAVIAVLGFALAAVFQARPLIAAAFMRFYWFRLADFVVPLAAALWMSAYVLWPRSNSRVAGGLLAAALVLPVIHLSQVTYERYGSPPRADGPDRVVYADWLDICRAAKERTPRDAQFLTPRLAQTFHWHAERKEVVNQKDIPQDARSIVEWSQRLREIHKLYSGGLPLAAQGEDELLRLAAKYKADYVITDVAPPLALPLVHANVTYALYDLRPAGARVTAP
jgi:hypothetical protein